MHKEQEKVRLLLEEKAVITHNTQQLSQKHTHNTHPATTHKHTTQHNVHHTTHTRAFTPLFWISTSLSPRTLRLFFYAWHHAITHTSPISRVRSDNGSKDIGYTPPSLAVHTYMFVPFPLHVRLRLCFLSSFCLGLLILLHLSLPVYSYF